MALTGGEENSRDELIQCVSLDQAIAAKVLQTINSAYFGMSQRVSSLEVAVGLLGDSQIRDIAIMCTTSGLLGVPIRGYGIPADQFWRHSVTMAIAARLLADKFGPWHRDMAFAAGLLHDIGKTWHSPRAFSTTSGRSCSTGLSRSRTKKFWSKSRKR